MPGTQAEPGADLQAPSPHNVHQILYPSPRGQTQNLPQQPRESEKHSRRAQKHHRSTPNRQHYSWCKEEASRRTQSCGSQKLHEHKCYTESDLSHSTAPRVPRTGRACPVQGKTPMYITGEPRSQTNRKKIWQQNPKPEQNKTQQTAHSEALNPNPSKWLEKNKSDAYWPTSGAPTDGTSCAIADTPWPKEPADQIDPFPILQTMPNQKGVPKSWNST